MDDSSVEELKSKTGIVTVDDLSYLQFGDLKAALPAQPVFKLRKLETIAQYVASGETIDLATDSTMIRQKKNVEVVTMKSNPDYLEYCRGKSFLLPKVVDPEKDNEHMMVLIQAAKEKIETKYGAVMGAGSTKRYLEARGFVNHEKLGAGQLMMNEELCLHHTHVLDDQNWLSIYKEYALAVKYGVLIMAVKPEYYQAWAKSSAYLEEVLQIPDGRLFAYIEHAEDDEGGVQGYIVSVQAQDVEESATVSNGKGYQLFHNGDYYHGSLKGGSRNGYGTYFYVEGDKYIGEWKNGAMNGHGTFSFTNGDEYVGEWKDGKRNGYGTSLIRKGKWEGDQYKGEWKDNNIQGQGTYTFANGDKYEGKFKDYKMHGQGTFTFANGDRYIGEWKDDNKHGQGKYLYANGDKYIGEWKDNKKHGQGTLTRESGDEYIGEWKDGKLHRRSTLTDADSTTKKVEHKNGEL